MADLSQPVLDTGQTLIDITNLPGQLGDVLGVMATQLSHALKNAPFVASEINLGIVPMGIR